MNPQIKRLIVIANIVAYAVVAFGIYTRKKGGLKALLPAKKHTLKEMEAMLKEKKISLPPVKIPGVAKAGPAASPVPQRPAAAKVPPSPAPVRAPETETIARLPETRKLLEQMQAKERALLHTYDPQGRRDPFVPLVGVSRYFESTKFTPDEMADLSIGLSEEDKRKVSPFTLSGIILSKRGESFAIINDQILQEGDIINDYKVARIEKGKVTLVRGKRTITLNIPAQEVESETLILKRLSEKGRGK